MIYRPEFRRVFPGCYRIGYLTVRFRRLVFTSAWGLMAWWKGRIIVDVVYPRRKPR